MKNILYIFAVTHIVLCTTAWASQQTSTTSDVLGDHTKFNRAWFDKEIKKLELQYQALRYNPDQSSKLYIANAEQTLKQQSQNLLAQQAAVDTAKKYNLLSPYETTVFDQDIESKKICDHALRHNITFFKAMKSFDNYCSQLPQNK